jgi:hypothetical protein
MKYLCLIYIDADKLDQSPPEECLRYAAVLRERGQCLAAEALRVSLPASTLRLLDEEPSVTDGPFVETKELLAGFYVLDTKNFEEAVELASGIPPLKSGRVELRPVWE